MTFVPRPRAHFALSPHALDEIASAHGMSAARLASILSTPPVTPLTRPDLATSPIAADVERLRLADLKRAAQATRQRKGMARHG